MTGRLKRASGPRERAIICDCNRLCERIDDEEDRYTVRQIAQRAIVARDASHLKAKEAGDS